MDYDKNSFLAGVAVGRRLKGWASSGDLSVNISMTSGVGGASVINVNALQLDTPNVIFVSNYGRLMLGIFQLDTPDVIFVSNYSEV